MEDRFKTNAIGNVLHSLSNEDALRVMDLSLAANDLTLNVEALRRFPESENMYFFVTSLSILRELAKLVANIDTSSFQGKMSWETEKLLGEVKSSLTSFEKGSVVKDVLSRPCKTSSPRINTGFQSPFPVSGTPGICCNHAYFLRDFKGTR